MVGPADGRDEGASEGPEDGSKDGETLGMLDGTLERVEEGDDVSFADGFELGFWLTVGSSDIKEEQKQMEEKKDIVRELVPPTHDTH